MKGGILFVDDEPRVLEGIENLLFDLDGAWKISFATSGAEAIAALEQHRYDVLVTDMKMPGMDGATLIEHVRARWPSIICLVLSGRTEVEQARRALPLIHDYIAKPADPERFVEKIARAVALARSCRSEALRGVAGRLRGLPPRPKTFRNYRQLVQAQAPLEDIALLLEQDPAMTVTLLHTVNSAFFGATQRITRVRDAVVRLGLEQTGHIVLSASVFARSGVDALRAESIFRHSHQVAEIAQNLVAPERQGITFLAGMIHDVGHVLLDEFFPEVPSATFTRDGRLIEGDIAAEEAVFGFHHAHAGAYLLRLWNLDEEIALAVEHHHAPEALPQRDRTLALAVFAADAAMQEAYTNTIVKPHDVLFRAREIAAAGGRS